MPTFHFYCVLCGTALQTSSDSRYDLAKCDGCSRYVPVPRLFHGLGDATKCPPVFPPGVLELLVKFQCTACGSALHADARCEGRDVVCPSCGARTGIPRWSSTPGSSLPSDTGEKTRSRPPHLPTLSVEEIDFLRGAASGKPEVAA